MHSLSCFDRPYQVKTFYTDDEAWRHCEDWKDAKRRNIVLRDYLRVPVKQVIYAREVHSGSVFAVSSETVRSLESNGENCVAVPSGEYDALVTEVPGIFRPSRRPLHGVGVALCCVFGFFLFLK